MRDSNKNYGVQVMPSISYSIKVTPEPSANVTNTQHAHGSPKWVKPAPITPVLSCVPRVWLWL